MICKIRDKEIKETPEELVRQKYIDIMLNEYKYNKDNIYLEYPVKKSPSDNKTYPIDICILENSKEKIFIEIKKEGEKSDKGLIQLQNYMSLNEHVLWGVWTNGEETIYTKKVIENNKINYREVYNVPLNGYFDIKEQIKISDLRSSENLKVLFKNMRSYISAHSVGTTRDETIAKELVKIILCKTYDEKFKTLDSYSDFYSTDGDDKETSLRIKSIYNQVKIKYDEVFDINDEISLDDKSIAYTISQLQGISLISSSRNVVSEAFETIIGYSLKGDSGQFFTPKNIVKLIVYIVNPQKNEKIIDPATGSGGFLIESMLYNWEKFDNYDMNEIAIVEEQKDYAMKNIYGIEKDEFLAQITKAYMAVLGDGKSGLCVEDSLDYITNWKNNLIKMDYFDIVMTNPPFGKNIKMDEHISKQYFSNKIDVAFLERSIALLKDNGKIAIVLSETIFHAPSYKKIREKFFYSNNILALIDLPHDTFRPFNNAKCIVVILEKNKQQQENVMLINLKEIGHTHTGEKKYIYDYDKRIKTEEIADDTPKVIEHLLEKNLNNDLIKNISFTQIKQKDILVPRYYFKNELEDYHKTITINELIKEGIVKTFSGQGSPNSHFKGKGTIPYIRVKDIVNLEININEMDNIPEYEALKIKKGQPLPKEKDIIMVWRGSYRIGDVGLVYKKDLKSVYTKELLFLRVDKKNIYNLTNENLMYFLNSKLVKSQIKDMIFIDTTLPTLYDRWKYIRIPILNKKEMENITNNINRMYSSRKKYWEIYDNIIDRSGDDNE